MIVGPHKAVQTEFLVKHLGNSRAHALQNAHALWVKKGDPTVSIGWKIWMGPTCLQNFNPEDHSNLVIRDPIV